LTAYLTKKEAAALLRMSERTLERWISEEGLPVIRLGGLVRIRRESLDQFLKDRETVKNAFAEVVDKILK